MILCSGGTHGSHGSTEGKGQLSWEVRGVSHEKGIRRAVGKVLENGKNEEGWKSSAFKDL